MGQKVNKNQNKNKDLRHFSSKKVSSSEVLKPLSEAGLKPGVNWQRELIELINDIAMRDNVKHFEVLTAPDIKAVLENKKSSGPQKLKKVKEVLFAKRYPTIASMSGPRNIRIKQSKANIAVNSYPLAKIHRLVVEKDVSKYPLTKEILSKYDCLPVEYVEKTKIEKKNFKPGDLLIAKQKGRFLKRCPGTPKYNCCHYYILNLGIGCQFNCTYCFLHQYMNTPFIAYVNIENVFEEVAQFCSNHPNKIIRLGSGEFIDSIAFDDIASYNQILIPTLSKITNLLLEIKTKSKKVDHLLGLEHHGRVVISFSLNSYEMAKKEELLTASIPERIQAAKKCQGVGYKIGFHFDPLIHYENWEKDYKQVVDLIFENIKPQNIAWISLGALRFNPRLKPIIQQKFPQSKIIYGELVPGLDGKLRYFLPIRKRMFKILADSIKAYSARTPIYLCMESKELAKEVGAIPNFRIRNSSAL